MIDHFTNIILKIKFIKFFKEFNLWFKNIFYLIDDIVAEKAWMDAKSNFQEASQENENITY